MREREMKKCSAFEYESTLRHSFIRMQEMASCFFHAGVWEGEEMRVITSQATIVGWLSLAITCTVPLSIRSNLPGCHILKAPWP